LFHFLRTTHRWIGITASIFLLVIAATGFLLATKDTFGWVKPPTHSGAEVEGLEQVVSLDQAAQSAFALGIDELKTRDDIERIDYRPGKNVFKIVTHRGYHEVQVCGRTGDVLNVATRVDQIAEDIHDMSFFAENLKLYGLPIVAVLLFCLGLTGVCIYFIPVIRRWKFKRTRG
jgi:uncharacterized iron-regulated membrane protein